MRTIFTLIASLFLTTTILAQAPQSFKYQALVRNTEGEPVATSTVSFRISILENTETGTAVYTETHNASTNSQGHISLQIGSGTSSDDFTAIDWGSNTHFMKIEIDTEGGTDYAHMGTSQLLSVPYAMHASTAENVDDADADETNELQNLNVSGNELSISDGNSVNLSSTGLWETNGSNILYDTGNVGIGTNVPQQQLHVDGNTRIDGILNSGLDGVGNSWYRAAFYQPNAGLGSAIYLLTADSDSTVSDGAQISLEEGANPHFSILNRENGGIRFLTNGPSNERMRITENGLVGIGNDSPESSLHIESSETRTDLTIGDQDLGFDDGTDVTISNGFGTSYLYIGQENSNKGFIGWNYDETASNASFNIGTYSGNNDLILQSAGGDVGIDIAGTPSYKLEVNGTAGKPGGGSWSNSSDIRLKNVNGDYDKGLDEINRLEPIVYSYKEDNARGLPTEEEYIGFVAQEVQKVFPEAIEEGEDGYLNFNMHSLNVAVINALQELKAENEELRKRIEALENQ